MIKGDGYVGIDFWRESGVAWFILALFFMNVITFYTKRFRPSYILVLSILLSMLAGYTKGDMNLFCWLRVVVFYPFFYAGYAVSLEDLTKWLDKRILKLISGIGFLAYFVVCYLGIDKIFWARFLFTGRSYSFLEYGALYGGILRLGTYLVSFALVFMFLALVPQRRFFFSTLGARSLSVYMFHYVFINLYVHSFLYQYLFRNFPNTWEWLLCPIGIGITLLCSVKPLDMFCKWILSGKGKYRESIRNDGRKPIECERSAQEGRK